MAKAKQAQRVVDPRRAMKIFKSAVQRTWSFPQSYRKVLRRIGEVQQGKRRGSELVILDDEYSPSSQQLWEFAIIERVSGRTLINTIIEHQNGIDHNELKPYPFMKWLSRSKASAVYSPSRLSIDSMTVHQAAAKLKEVGITPDTIILVYQASTMDLRLLRELLESSGYFGILPPDENCVPMLQPLRQNLTKGQPADRRIRLNLENLFPLMFPRHSLIGLNHQALVDCQQTRLVCMAFDELCKPAEERGEQWHPDTIQKVSQRSILDWLSRPKPSEKRDETLAIDETLVIDESSTEGRVDRVAVEQG